MMGVCSLKFGRLVYSDLVAMNYLWLCLLILLAGDIEPNPGPRPVKFPCQICNKAAKWGQRAVECEHCSGWFHASCLGMNNIMYQTLIEHPSYSWVCDNCGLPSFSTTFIDSYGGFDTSNSFGPLQPRDCSSGDLSFNNTSGPGNPTML